MIRPVEVADLPALARLFQWMDADPSRRALAPEGRSPEALAFEVEEGWVLEEGGEPVGFVGLVPFWRGAALEGPVSRAQFAPLIEAALGAARARGQTTVYAFPSVENERLAAALEAAGFSPVHTTHFFESEPRAFGFAAPAGVAIEEAEAFDPEVYRRLYRESDEGWSLRLGWTDMELLEHFAEPENRLLFAYLEGEPVGLAELERYGDTLEVAYLGVVPGARGRGIGQALLEAASRLARESGAGRLVVRAHDHEKEALRLYERLGFSPLEAVLTYAKELAPEE